MAVNSGMALLAIYLYQGFKKFTGVWWVFLLATQNAIIRAGKSGR